LGITPHIQGSRKDIITARDAIKKWESGWTRGTVALADFNPEGCMAGVTVAPKEYRQKPLIGLRYLGYKWLAPDQLSGFFKRLVQVEMRSLKTNAYGKPCD